MIGAGLHYRQLLERWVERPGDANLGAGAAWTALALMPVVLHCVDVAYNRSARTERNLSRSRCIIELGRQAAASSRSMSCRTVS